MDLVIVATLFGLIVLGVSVYKKKKKKARLAKETQTGTGGNSAPDKGGLKPDVVENIK